MRLLPGTDLFTDGHQPTKLATWPESRKTSIPNLNLGTGKEGKKMKED